MTIIDLNSSELDRIIHSLGWHKQGMLDNQPVSKMTVEITDSIQYLIDKLEDSLIKALEEEDERKKK